MAKRSVGKRKGQKPTSTRASVSPFKPPRATIYPHPHEFSRHSAHSLDFRLYRPALKHPSLSLSNLERPSAPRLCRLRVCFHLRPRATPSPLLLGADRPRCFHRPRVSSKSRSPPFLHLSLSSRATCHLGSPFALRRPTSWSSQRTRVLSLLRDSRDIFSSAVFVRQDLANGPSCAVISNVQTQPRGTHGGRQRETCQAVTRVRVHSHFGHSKFYRAERRICLSRVRAFA